MQTVAPHRAWHPRPSKPANSSLEMVDRLDGTYIHDGRLGSSSDALGRPERGQEGGRGAPGWTEDRAQFAEN